MPEVPHDRATAIETLTHITPGAMAGVLLKPDLPIITCFSARVGEQLVLYTGKWLLQQTHRLGKQ